MVRREIVSKSLRTAALPMLPDEKLLLIPQLFSSVRQGCPADCKVLSGKMLEAQTAAVFKQTEHRRAHSARISTIEPTWCRSICRHCATAERHPAAR